MSTRGSISILKDGKCLATYTHWDSYLSHKGNMLLTFHNSQEAAERIIQLGNSSIISERLDDLPNGWSFDNYPSFLDEVNYAEFRKYSVFYGRDRGEKEQDAAEFDTWEDAMVDYENEYNYLWKDGKWWVQFDSRGLLELTEELIKTES